MRRGLAAGNRLDIAALEELEKGEVLLRGVGTLRYYFPPNASSVQLQPCDLTIHTKKWFLGAGFLGAASISLKEADEVAALVRDAVLEEGNRVTLSLDRLQRAIIYFHHYHYYVSLVSLSFVSLCIC